MKQTAVEWLYDNLKSYFEHNGDLLEVVQFSFEKAKEMEKQQIIDAYHKGCADQLRVYPDAEYNSEQYYNETFKK